MLLVTVAVSERHQRRRYSIKENQEGEFWFWKVKYLDTKTECLLGYEPFLAGLFLTAQHAEDITGLHVPAAWDRLREMVQDSGTYYVPPLS